MLVGWLGDGITIRWSWGRVGVWAHPHVSVPCLAVDVLSTLDSRTLSVAECRCCDAWWPVRIPTPVAVMPPQTVSLPCLRSRREGLRCSIRSFETPPTQGVASAWQVRQAPGGARQLTCECRCSPIGHDSSTWGTHIRSQAAPRHCSKLCPWSRPPPLETGAVPPHEVSRRQRSDSKLAPRFHCAALRVCPHRGLADIGAHCVLVSLRPALSPAPPPPALGEPSPRRSRWSLVLAQQPFPFPDARRYDI